VGAGIPRIPEISNYRQKNVAIVPTKDQVQNPLDEKSKLYLILHSCQPEGKFLPSAVSCTTHRMNLMTACFGHS